MNTKNNRAVWKDTFSAGKKYNTIFTIKDISDYNKTHSPFFGIVIYI